MRRFGRAAFAAGLAMLLAGVLAPALAAPGDNGNPDKPGYFTCRASVARVTVTDPTSGEETTVEPWVANDGEVHCQDDSAGLFQDLEAAGVPKPEIPGVTYEVLEASTDAESRSASAAAKVLHVEFDAPDGNHYDISVLTSFATVTCQDNKQGHPTARRPAFDGGSGILSVKQNGEEQAPQVLEPGTTEIPGVGTITVDEQEHRNTAPGRGEEFVVRALHIRTEIADAVVAESSVGYSGQPCAPGQTKD